MHYSKLSMKKFLGFSTSQMMSVVKAFVFYAIPPDLLIQGQILVDARQKIVLCWSAKSGATFGVKWFFVQTGLLEKALNHNGFVHLYRDDVYRFSKEHRQALGHFLKQPHEYEIIKIVRHPLKRAVSSYIHAVKYNFAYQDISRFLDRDIDRAKSFSFREFVGYLESLDVESCNIHFRTQLHPLERRGKITVDHIIDLEESHNKLGELEKSLGLRQTNLERLSKSIHNTTRTKTDGFYGDLQIKANDAVLPPAKNFYDSELLARVYKIYMEDFERYGYLPVLD